jgi:peroxiredoxin
LTYTRVFLALSALALAPGVTAGDQLRATLNVSGAAIDLRVRHEDGRPAAGLEVRLLYGRQLTTAVARTDKNGRWSHTVDYAGAYEAIIDAGTAAEEPLHLSFAVLTAPEPAGFPWMLTVPFLASLAGASLALTLGIKKSRRLSLAEHCPSGSNGVSAPPSGALDKDRSEGLTARQAFVMAGLMAGGAVLLGWSAWRQWQPAPGAPAGPDVAAAAREFLRKKEVAPLSVPLAQVLADAAQKHIKTQAHPLLDQPAPDFELPYQRGKTWHLHELLARGSVVLIFYYGYHCNHCVSQLFAVHDDIHKFRELGAEVLAVSADPPELTRDRFKQYGEFAFPVLADPGNKIAQTYGIYKPASGKTPEDLQHGTFVIGRDGRIHWTHHAYEPFTGNATLLYELARLEGRLKRASP